MSAHFDHIIIGGGSAGCALAARLARDTDDSICVIEAGPGDADPRVRVPFGLVSLMGSARDWRHKTTPQAHADGRCISVPRGRMVGGSGSMNSMVWFRGRQDDFDAWHVPGWSWNDVAQDFDHVEAHTRPTRLATPHPVTKGFAQALSGNDPDSPPTPERISAGVVHCNLHKGRRWSAADAFLRPALATGRVTLRTGAEVDRLILTKARATGLRLRDGTDLHATKTVTLAAGSIQSPMVLFRSGLGPGGMLRAAGLPVIRDMPGIGANLHDHPGVGLHFAGRASGYGLELRQLPHWALSPLRWLTTRRGVLASPTVEGCAFFRADGGAGQPDVQCHFIPFMLGHRGRSIVWGAGYFADVVVCRPKSRGALTIGSDPYAPQIDLNLLHDQRDLDLLVQGIARLRQILSKAPLEPHRAPEVHPGAQITGTALADHIRASCGTAYHPVGTVAMGVDPARPVAPDLRLRGYDNLFVADASVMPAVTSANTNAPSMMIGWRAGAFVAGSHTKRSAA